MSANQFTQEQILSGIRIFCRETLDRESPLDPDLSFIKQAKLELIFDDRDYFASLRIGLQRLFGFTCPKKEWELFLGLHVKDPSEWEKNIVPQLTVRALADFIRERLNPISLEPVTLLGKPCLTAGIFRGLEQLVDQINPKVTRFAPSTPIRARLRGVRLHSFWNRLRWIVEDQLPPPPQITLSPRGCLHSLLFKLGAGLLIYLWRRDWEGALVGIVITFFFLSLWG